MLNEIQRSNQTRMLAVWELHCKIPYLQKATSDRDQKIFLAKVGAGISFVADKMFYSVNKKWNLSEKQLVCLEKAEAVIMEAGL